MVLNDGNQKMISMEANFSLYLKILNQKPESKTDYYLKLQIKFQPV